MKIPIRCGFLLMVSVLAATVIVAGPASAHEKWFQNASNFPLRWDLFFRPLPLFLAGTMLLAVLVCQRCCGGCANVGFYPVPRLSGLPKTGGRFSTDSCR